MGVNYNQHFVPQFYLRRFSTDKSSINLTLCSSGETIRGASIKGQCSKRKFYSDVPELDGFLTYLESRVLAFLDLFSGKNPNRIPNESDVERFLCFLLAQIYRTPLAKDLGDMFEDGFHSIVRRASPAGSGLPDDLKGSPFNNRSMIRFALTLYPQLSDMFIVSVRAPKSVEFITCDNPVVLLTKPVNRVECRTALACRTPD